MKIRSLRLFPPLVIAVLWSRFVSEAASPAQSDKLPAATERWPDKIPCAVEDRQAFLSPARLQLNGWIGTRVQANAQNRMAKIDTARLLEGYRKRPGRQTWDGEHVGKWLHAATLAWVHTGDPALREKLDVAVAELMKCQLEDGYLGTYLPKHRWTHWDVWAHKYNLIGLLTYLHYTGNQEPLTTCRRMADLLCNTFGDEPGKRDIIKAGHHVGMAPTSVLEPMVRLYRLTGEPRYLDFCEYILRTWEQPNGPKIISTLLTAKRVDKVANGKAYEMLSCLNGALEYYRTVGGNRQILEACLNAWQDIVDKRLYITGAASYHELFHDDFDLPNVANVGETCVTTTWIQFNAHLLRLTGEARFAEQLERVVLNQLFGAQRCDGSGWGYYVQMEGKKPYSSTLDGHCCLSSGPRGIALIPTFAVSTDSDGVVVNLFEKGIAQLNLRNQTAVSLVTETRFPSEGRINITVNPSAKKSFAVKLRIPAWCPSASLQVNDQSTEIQPGSDGYAVIRRPWSAGDRIQLNLKLEPRVIIGDHMNAGKIAILYGPLVLAADQALLGEGQSLSHLSFANPDLASLKITPESAPAKIKCWPGAQVFRVNAVARKSTETIKTGSPFQVRLVPFADAGGSGTSYKVWLPLRQATASDNVLLDGMESRSRQGNLDGSINDDDFKSVVVTFDGKPSSEDWFAITLDEPVNLDRIVFAHGSTFHDGGWFDTTSGKPRIQVKARKDDDWKTVGELQDYPSTTAKNPAGLKGGERFAGLLVAPIRAVAVRVIGRPACGDNPKQAFSSCAELQAYLSKNK